MGDRKTQRAAIPPQTRPPACRRTAIYPRTGGPMSVFFHQYFDLDIIRDNFSYVLKGFGQTVELSLVSAALALTLGLILALLRASPGRPMLPVRGVTIAYIDVMRG